MSNEGRWNGRYQHLVAGHPQADVDSVTYGRAAEFLQDCAVVEDWGCGKGFSGAYTRLPVKYRGIDGSRTPFADVWIDLTRYRSRTEGILIRHVLEHDYNWSNILQNAVASFRKKLCVIVSTPLADITHELGFDDNFNVPDLALCRDDIVWQFAGLAFREESLMTAVRYGVEHIFYVERL